MIEIQSARNTEHIQMDMEAEIAIYICTHEWFIVPPIAAHLEICGTPGRPKPGAETNSSQLQARPPTTTRGKRAAGGAESELCHGRRRWGGTPVRARGRAPPAARARNCNDSSAHRKLLPTRTPMAPNTRSRRPSATTLRCSTSAPR